MEWERQSGGQPRALLITRVGINIECLMDEKDVREFIKREEFEKLSADLLERVLVPIKKALADSGLGVDGVNSVELVSSRSRIPAIIRILMGFFGKEPRRILNASECMAKGCALRSAMLSLVFRVREYEVTFIPYITVGDPDMSTTSMALKVLDSCW